MDAKKKAMSEDFLFLFLEKKGSLYYQKKKY